MEASSHLELIQAQLDTLISREAAGNPDLRELARDTAVLPIFYDWTGVGGIRCSDGEILWVDYEPPYWARRIDAQRVRNMILFRAHLEYPTLRVLIPPDRLTPGSVHRAGGLAFLSSTGSERIGASATAAVSDGFRPPSPTRSSRLRS